MTFTVSPWVPETNGRPSSDPCCWQGLGGPAAHRLPGHTLAGAGRCPQPRPPQGRPAAPDTALQAAQVTPTLSDAKSLDGTGSRRGTADLESKPRPCRAVTDPRRPGRGGPASACGQAPWAIPRGWSPHPASCQPSTRSGQGTRPRSTFEGSEGQRGITGQAERTVTAPRLCRRAQDAQGSPASVSGPLQTMSTLDAGLRPHVSVPTHAPARDRGTRLASIP